LLRLRWLTAEWPVSGIQASMLNFLIEQIKRSPFEGRKVSFVSPTSSLTEPKSNQSATRKGPVSLAREIDRGSARQWVIE
jgi:hypothetical protein